MTLASGRLNYHQHCSGEKKNGAPLVSSSFGEMGQHHSGTDMEETVRKGYEKISNI